MAMDFISSKNIFLLARDTLKLIDKRLMKHGSRTGYILYKMLECEGKYEKFELADFVMLATLHDIGAYRTNDINDMLRFEAREYMPHSIYGFLFLKFLSPMGDLSKILLYHHFDYYKIKEAKYEYLDIACCLNLAEKVDIYSNALGSKFDFGLFSKYAGTKYTESAVDLFSQAQIKYDILAKLKTEEYEQELDELMDYIMFTNEDKKRFMEMLMYCLGFCSEYKIKDSVTCTCICEKLAEMMEMNAEQSDKLYYGALLHDIGMLTMPKGLVDANRKLTDEETEFMRKHVETAEAILKNRMDQEVVDIACRHHERLNGSGYPKKLFRTQMTDSDMILQVADTVTALVGRRAYRGAFKKEEVIEILQREADEKRLNSQIVNLVNFHYDSIMQEVSERSRKILHMNNKLQAQYGQVLSMFHSRG